MDECMNMPPRWISIQTSAIHSILNYRSHSHVGQEVTQKMAKPADFNGQKLIENQMYNEFEMFWMVLSRVALWDFTVGSVCTASQYQQRLPKAPLLGLKTDVVCYELQCLFSMGMFSTLIEA